MQFTLLLALVAVGSAHVHMASPGALRSADNPVAKAANVVDDSINAPLLPDGSNFPCKGYHLDILDNKHGSESVADWAPGSSQKVTFGAGGAGHSGGSCQLSLSVDQGKSFKVIKSFIGGCPAIPDSNGQGSLVPELAFNVPKDTPAGPAIFSWTWFNKVGNREMYQNCAHVTVTDEGAGSEAVPFDRRPNIFEANNGKGCATVEGSDVEFPDPGPDSVIAPMAKLGDPTGGAKCGAAISDSAPINATVAPDRGLEVRPSGSSSTSTTSGPASGSSASPNTALTTDPADLGRCGPVNGASYTCDGSKHGASCSSFGYCGNTPEHTGPGCQPQFGKCPGTVSATKTLAVESSATFFPSSASSFLDAQLSSSQSSLSKAMIASSTTSSAPLNTTSLTTSATASSLSLGNTTSPATASTTSAIPAVSGNSTTPATNLPIHPEGKCGVLQGGSKFTCDGSGRGCACSEAGWCGISLAHYGRGCQSAFGTCGVEAASCKVTVPSGAPGNATATSAAQSTDPVVTTSIFTTTTPVLTVTVTETVASDPTIATNPLISETAVSTAAKVPTTLITETKPAISSKDKSNSTSMATGPTGTIVARYKRPEGSFLDFLNHPKVVSGTRTQRLAKPTGGAVFGTRP